MTIIGLLEHCYQITRVRYEQILFILDLTFGPTAVLADWCDQPLWKLDQLATTAPHMCPQNASIVSEIRATVEHLTNRCLNF